MINVLVAEDEPLILNAITNLISSIDSDFIIMAKAKNGLEVLQSLNTQPIDVIFTDIKMPMLDGLDLIQEIRNRSLDIPIVIISGYNDFSYAKRALILGVFDYLLKPINTEELANTLKKLKKPTFRQHRSNINNFSSSFPFGIPHQIARCLYHRSRIWQSSYYLLAVILLIRSIFLLLQCPSGKQSTWIKSLNRFSLPVLSSEANREF